MENLKKEPWRLVVGLAAIGFIVYQWVKKDIAGIYSSLPPEELVPLVVTTIGVNLAKVAAIAAGILLVKWLAGKLTNQNQ